jgi:excisionase family DNA binding protein
VTDGDDNHISKMTQERGSISMTKLLTIKEAAKLLNISETLMRRLVWANEIGYIDINKGGRHIMARFTTKHIEDFLREREVQPG